MTPAEVATGEITYLEAIREALFEEMERDSIVFCLGEDIGGYGGAFKVTAGLMERFGENRVLDTPISEAAIVGAAGLPSTLAAARAGKRILLANKESLVMAGELLTAAVREGGAQVIPVDSEHNAIFQCLPSSYPAVGAPQAVAACEAEVPAGSAATVQAAGSWDPGGSPATAPGVPAVAVRTRRAAAGCRSSEESTSHTAMFIATSPGGRRPGCSRRTPRRRSPRGR